MSVVLVNNAVSRLSSSLTAVASTLSVTSGEGSKFPSPAAGEWFPLVLVKVSGAVEILKCTARSGDVLTVVRAQEGTAALSFSVGDRVELRMTAAVVEDINARLAQTVIDLATTIANLGLTGAVSMFAQTTAPAGWLKANGDAVSRTTYADLFAKIGTSYGVGDGSTTFNLPDPRGLFTRALDDGKGYDTGRTVNSVQAGLVLSHTHTAAVDPRGAHTHSGVTNTAGEHFHEIARAGTSAIGSGGPNLTTANGEVGLTRPTFPAGNHQHGLAIDATGDHVHAVTVAANVGYENRPTNIAFLFCIKY